MKLFGGQHEKTVARGALQRSTRSSSGRRSPQHAAPAKHESPAYFGAEVSGVRRHRPDYLLVLFSGLLILISLIVMYAIGPSRADVMNAAYGTNYPGTYFFTRQLINVGVALGAFIIMAVVPLSFFSRHAKRILLIGLGLCFGLVLLGYLHVPFAKPVLGAYRWFTFGSVTFQPSEMLKFGVLFFLGGFLGARARQGKIDSRQDTLVPVGVVGGLSLFAVIFLQKDLGTGLALGAIILAMLFIAGISRRTMWLVLGIAAAGVLFSIITAPHRMERIVTYLGGIISHNSEQSVSTSDEDYHINQAKIAIGTGGLSGRGINGSVQSTGYLPEAINDSIFAVMGEMFGLVGLAVILGLYFGLCSRILRTVRLLTDMRHKLLAAGVFAWVSSHILLNVAAMTGLMPLTGVPLPLLSYGGTSIMFITAALGLVFHLSRYTVYNEAYITQTGGQHEGSSSRRGVGRTRYTSRRSTKRT